MHGVWRPRFPVVYIWDSSTKTESMLHVGWHPVVSSDGKSVVVRNWEGSCAMVQAATGKSRIVKPSTNGAIIAMPDNEVLLVWSLPTNGFVVKYTKNNSPIRGPKEMLAIKLHNLKNGEFQTVAPYVDPRFQVSFGTIKK